MASIYDLHTHSHCSDGQLSPSALVQLAKEQGVEVLALTDHDTFAGVKEAQQAAGDDLKVIAGVEFSSLWMGRNIHVVGLNFPLDNAELTAAVASQGEVRLQRAELIAQRLEKHGIKGALLGAKHYANGEIGRPHFAQYLVDAGYVDTFAQAFKRYLGTGKIGDVKHQWPTLAEVVKWIVNAGGTAVLAHPDKYDLTRTKLYQLTTEFVEAGGHAVEVTSGLQELSVTAKLARLAKDFELLASCGSDFHSTANPWQMPGKMSPIPEGCQPVWEQW